MTALPDPVRAAAEELRTDLEAAVYVLTDLADVDALEAAGLRAAHGASHELNAMLVRCQTVVIVQAVDGTLREYVARIAPHADVMDVGLPPTYASVSTMLGRDPTVAVPWDDAQVSLARTTWLDWCEKKVLLSVAPSVDFPTPFPTDALPKTLRDMVVAGAESQGVDVAFWAVPLVPILAGAIGSTRSAQATADWVEPTVVWAAVVAPSGAGKTPPLQHLLRPVREFDFALDERTRLLTQQQIVDMERWNSASTEERGPPPPSVPMLAAMVRDCTLEQLAVLLRDNPRGLLLAVDELAEWLRNHNRYRRGGGDEQAWQALFNAIDLKQDRKATGGGEKRIVVRHPTVSVVGTVQPGIAQKYLGTTEHRASGTCARILLAAPPLSPARLSGKVIPEGVKDAYRGVVRRLLDLQLDDGGNPVRLPLTKAAYEQFQPWHDRNGDACFAAALAHDYDVAAALSKLRGYALRFATIFALVRAAEGGGADLLVEIDEVAMASAIKVADYFEREAVRVYTGWAEEDVASRIESQRGGASGLAERLAAALSTGPKDREALRAATGRNFGKPMMDAALAVLQTSGRAQCERTQARRGRPREVWSLTSDIPRAAR